MCSFQKHERGYNLPRRTVPDYNLIFVTRGRVVWVIADIEFPLSPGGLVIVPPDVEHHAFSYTQRVTLVSTHVEATLPGGQDVFQLLVPPRFQRVERDCPFDQYLRGAAREYERPATTEQAAMLPHWSQLIVRELFRHDAKLNLLHYRPADPLVAGVLEEIERRVAQPFTLDDLARRSGFSAQHLNRVFQRVLGITPLKYLARVRMERAADLLRDGRLSIAAIGQAVGFDDPYYFSRQFSQHHKTSPSQYRTRAGSDSPSQGSGRPFTGVRSRGR